MTTPPLEARERSFSDTLCGPQEPFPFRKEKERKGEWISLFVKGLSSSSTGLPFLSFQAKEETSFSIPKRETL